MFVGPGGGGRRRSTPRCRSGARRARRRSCRACSSSTRCAAAAANFPRPNPTHALPRAGGGGSVVRTETDRIPTRLKGRKKVGLRFEKCWQNAGLPFGANCRGGGGGALQQAVRAGLQQGCGGGESERGAGGRAWPRARSAMPGIGDVGRGATQGASSSFSVCATASACSRCTCSTLSATRS